MHKRLSLITASVLIYYAFVSISSCQKEYYKAGSIQSSIPSDSGAVQDSNQIADTVLSTCESCNNADSTGGFKWGFTIGSSRLCGNVTNGVLSPDGDAMTFFGPSLCSIDSGLIITAFFDKILREDRYNIIASRAYLQYYDNVNISDVLQSKPADIFSLTIDNYTHQTGIATGTFNGAVRNKNGNIVIVEDGRFIVKF